MAAEPEPYAAAGPHDHVLPADLDHSHRVILTLLTATGGGEAVTESGETVGTSGGGIMGGLASWWVLAAGRYGRTRMHSCS